MGRDSFDVPLSEKEFLTRVKNLTKEGKALTMRNVDPGFCKDYETSDPFYPLKWLLSKLSRRDWVAEPAFDRPLKGYQARNRDDNAK